jgi:3-oxoacyl-[acyl-carrier-protein] synthase-3
MFEAFVRGTGAYVPEKVLTNDDLARIVDTSDEWITQRTGIRERRIAAPEQSTSDLALEAGRIALADGGLDPEELDAIIVCTLSPDTISPAAAVYVQRGLKATRAAAFDLNAACTGFVYGMTVGSSLIKAGVHRNVLVIGAETLSRFVDWTDRTTCILFGDGAGAALLSRATEGESRILDHFLRSDGEGCELIYIPAGGSRSPATQQTLDARLHFLKMQGREVFKFATRTMVELLETALERNHLRAEDIDLLIPHQVNSRVIETVLRKIPLPAERVFLNLERYGNTSAASVPIAIREAVQAGKLRRGHLLLLVAFGAGLTWGYNLVRW